MMKPSLGRIVIFNAGSAQDASVIEEHAAIIVKCDSNEENAPVNLCIFRKGGNHNHGLTNKNDVIQGDEIGQWHEPKRV